MQFDCLQNAHFKGHTLQADLPCRVQRFESVRVQHFEPLGAIDLFDAKRAKRADSTSQRLLVPSNSSQN